jgi:hypothetical protein
MHEVERVELLHLVPLQVPDEMPAERSIDLRHLPERLLHLVLPYVPHSGVPRCQRRVGTVGLRHGHHGHALAVPASRLRPLDLLVYRGQP